jgi:HPt (histidine-containing phosphotransfer) domain-containing protein
MAAESPDIIDSPENPVLEVFNRSLALERLDGDPARLEDLLGAFKKNVHYVLQDLESAQKRKECERAESLAVELRESARRIGAEGLEDLAARMVEAARVKDFDEAETLLTHMGMELDWLLRILDENRCSGNL